MKLFYTPSTIVETKKLINEIIERAPAGTRLEMLHLISLVQHFDELENDFFKDEKQIEFNNNLLNKGSNDE